MKGERKREKNNKKKKEKEVPLKHLQSILQNSSSLILLTTYKIK
jgi:hypothetical protein